MKPRLLDLFCGGGGAAVGYARAGFDVVGIDIVPQPHYPFELRVDDALSFLEWLLATGYALNNFDAFHASPPCQDYSVTRSLHDAEYPRLIEPVRAMLSETCKPYVIENVVGAELIEPVTLCGSMFGLGVRRHRRFEVSGPLIMRPPCRHDLQPEPIDVTGGGPTKPGRTRTNGGVSRKPRNIEEARTAMGVDWPMTRAELNEAIPPAYTSFLGVQLLAAVGMPTETETP